MAFYINGKQLPEGVSFYDANGTQYPSGWLNQATEAQKTAIGITWQADPTPFDPRFYWDHNLPKALEDVTETVDGKEYVTKGLKSNFIAQVKDTAGKLLAQTDWYVIRKLDRNVEIPSEVSLKRTQIVTEANRLESDIQASTSVEGLIEVLNTQNWGK